MGDDYEIVVRCYSYSVPDTPCYLFLISVVHTRTYQKRVQNFSVKYMEVKFNLL